jgi:hypothetical protein
VIAKSLIPREKILLPPLLLSINFQPFTLCPLLYLVSLACLCYLLRLACLFFKLALGEFGLLELCRLTLLKFCIKVLLTKRKPNSPSFGPSILTAAIPADGALGPRRLTAGLSRSVMCRIRLGALPQPGCTGTCAFVIEPSGGGGGRRR